MGKKTSNDVAEIDFRQKPIECGDDAKQLISKTSIAIDLDFWKGRLKALFNRTASK